MTVKQLSVFVENRPGRLSAITRLLGDANINIRAMSIADTKDFGILRLIVDDAYSAAGVLKDADYVASLTQVLAFQIPDTPGGLSQLLSHFSDAKVNVEYMYSSLSKEASQAYMIFRVHHTEKSEGLLKAKGLKAIDDATQL